jgi:hypothetical protein
MKYVQPYGLSDTNAPYINGNPAAGIEGSIPPAEAFEHPMREIVGMIQNSGLIPTAADLLQLLKAIRRQYVNFAIDTGAVNAMAVTLVPALDAYSAGFPLRVLVAVTNTGATTVTVGGLGARALKRPDGSDLHAGDIVAGMVANLVDTGSVFQLQNAMMGVAGDTNVFSIGIPYTADSGTVNNILAVYSPAITTIAEGNYIAVKVAFTNTGPVTIKVNALTALPVKRQDGADLVAGDIFAAETILIEHHGTYYQCVSYVKSQLPVAPLLRGIRADKVGFASDYMPTSVGVWMTFPHTVGNSMQTSVFDGTELTVGAGEAGLWSISGQWVMPQIGIDTNFMSTGISVNGTGQALESTNTSAGTAGSSICTSTLRLNVGDKVRIQGYQQSGQGIYAVNSVLQYLTAYLVSV